MTTPSLLDRGCHSDCGWVWPILPHLAMGRAVGEGNPNDGLSENNRKKKKCAWKLADLCRCWVVFSAVLAGGTPVYTNSVIRWHRLVSVWVPLAGAWQPDKPIPKATCGKQPISRWNGCSAGKTGTVRSPHVYVLAALPPFRLTPVGELGRRGRPRMRRNCFPISLSAKLWVLLRLGCVS